MITIPAPKAFLFDLDGVIVDTAKYHFLAWRWMANQLGSDFTEHQNEELKGVGRMDSLNKILAWGNIELSEEEKTHWAKEKNDYYLKLISEMNESEILVGVVSFLNNLKSKNIKIALGSSSKNAEMILRKTNLLHYFDAIIDGRHLSEAKPHPQVFLLGATALQLQAHECIVVEDSTAGLQSAIAAGMQSIGIGTIQNLPQATWVVNNLSEVMFS